MQYLHQNFDKNDILRVVRALAIFRPSLIALQMPLTEEDEIFVEKCFQRSLIVSGATTASLVLLLITSHRNSKNSSHSVVPQRLSGDVRARYVSPAWNLACSQGGARTNSSVNANISMRYAVYQSPNKKSTDVEL